MLRPLLLALALVLVASPAAFAQGRQMPDEGQAHVPNGTSGVYKAPYPPASGQHWGNTWAEWQMYDDPIPPEVFVHNLEHGGIVLLIGNEATDAEKQTINDAYEAMPDDEECHHKRSLVTADPLLNSHITTITALVVLEGDSLTVDQIAAFTQTCRNHGREDICY